MEQCKGCSGSSDEMTKGFIIYLPKHSSGQLHNLTHTFFIGHICVNALTLSLFHMQFIDTISFSCLHLLGLLIYIQFWMCRNSVTMWIHFIPFSSFSAHLHLLKDCEYHQKVVYLIATYYLNRLSHWVERFVISDTLL
jgi:hypothetical protein